jgi:chromosomal replication initiation ATPase DnaA
MGSNMIAQFKFSNFIVDDNNEEAFSLAKSISEQFFTTYDPLIIYGSPCVGKTHLVFAIQNRLYCKNDELRERISMTFSARFVLSCNLTFLSALLIGKTITTVKKTQMTIFIC